MKKKLFLGPLIITMLLSTSLFAEHECSDGSNCKNSNTPTDMLGRFDKTRDLYLPQFDSKTDVDDIHSVAGVSTLLSDPRFAKVNFHAVAGAYGAQSGEYVPATDLFDMAFGSRWSDAHKDYETALKAVTEIVIDTLNNEGDVWIAEAGQSDFSADMVRQVKLELPGIDTRTRIHIVQHSDWNEESAAPANLAYVKSNTNYHKIADGNFTGNGTPGLNTDSDTEWTRVTTHTTTGSYWKKARAIANKYNGEDDRYLNDAIKAGGMDFSDTSESCWIFGFQDIYDVSEFFDRFITFKNSKPTPSQEEQN
ncbi:MAG: hypothetical protein QNK22_02350 [Xanthomonadales bacterium]|nr:hypothetical protein [Xanthomonadales bacterium]